jgi:hypothetical protein
MVAKARFGDRKQEKEIFFAKGEYFSLDLLSHRRRFPQTYKNNTELLCKKGENHPSGCDWFSSAGSAEEKVCGRLWPSVVKKCFK